MHTGFQFCHDAAAAAAVGCCPLSLTTLNALFWSAAASTWLRYAWDRKRKEGSEWVRVRGGKRRPNNKFERVQAHATLPPCPLFSTPLPQPFFSPATPLAPPLASTALWWQPLYNYLKLKLTVERVGKDYAHRIESQRVASHRITVDRAIDRHSGTHCRFCMLMCRSRELQRDAACANLLRVNIGSKKEWDRERGRFKEWEG